MDSNLKRLLKRNYLGVAYLPIHGKGYLVRTKGNKKDYIFFYNKLRNLLTFKCANANINV